MNRTRIRLLPAAILVLAASVLGAADVFGDDNAGRAAPGRTRVTMEELEIRGRERLPVRIFVPPVQDTFHRAPVRFDLIREDLAKPIPPWEIGSGKQRRGDDLADDQ